MKHFTQTMQRLGTAVCVTLALCCAAAGADDARTTTGDANTDGEAGIRLNFRGAELTSVLEYLSQAAGFVVVLDAEVSGKVDVWSHQTLSKDEAVDLLNTILNHKGYTAIRNGRTLTIVTREEASQRDLPVRTGGDPEAIPKNDEMVTQIIPVRYVDAVKLIDNLDLLIPEYATLSANESSNAVVITDTQANVRRMAEIVQALDTSISSISTVQVFPLLYADAKEIAEVVTKVFENPYGESGGNESVRQVFERMRASAGGRGGGRGGGGGASPSTGSAARQVASRVVAVGDERTNSLVVSAPDELMPTIVQLIEDIDVDTQDVTETRVFHLQHADAEEMVEIIEELFSDEEQSSNDQNRPRFGFRGMFGGRDGGRGGGGGGRGGGGQNEQGQRTQKEYEVLAVADIRTKSVVVSAAADMMERIATMIEELDSNPAKKKKVFVYRLENANAENVAEVLRNMFELDSIGSSSSSSTQNLGRGNVGQFTSTGGANSTRGGSTGATR